MPLPKILAPYLPEDHGAIEKVDHVLSPILPFSPVQPTPSRDNVIELYTLDEQSTEDLEPTDQNAMVLHPMYQPAHIPSPAMDLSPPVEFLQEQEVADDEPEISGSPITIVTHKQLRTSPLVTTDFIQSSPVQSNTEIFSNPITANDSTTTSTEIFSNPTTSDEILNNFTNSSSESFSNSIPNLQDTESKDFAMETSFRKSTESDFKTKCMRMIRNAKGLVCKPTSPKPAVSRAVTAAATVVAATPAPIVTSQTVINPPAAKHITQDRPTLRPIDTNFSSSFIKKEEVCSTPIYLQHQTTSQFPTKEKEPYESPVKGTLAYDIKVLCDGSFFGRW